ncbi:helix-turn-helix transcriptional regulator [Solimonas soli]|uniref:helix-turn-helix transcriptional regulator n=1 Tax=Solimonas soli TaxID=413479 RepID=UPI0004B972C1|nr:AraC family transcriptional regulator [Solimonas soli]
MSVAGERPPAAARAGLGGYLQISTRARHLLRSVRFAAPALIAVQSGRKQLRRGDACTVFEAGQWFAVPAGEQIDVENIPPGDGAPYEALCIEFDARLLRGERRDVEPSPWLRLRPDAALVQAVLHLRDGLATAPALPDSLLRHRFEEVWLALAEQGFIAGLRAEAGIAERVRMLIAADPARAWRSAEIAARLAMSPATLRRRLADEHSSLRALLDDLRLGQALAQLQSTTRPIERIAFDAGYRSASRFAAAFRRRYGLAPSAVRVPQRAR